jgi:hypothetical protein
MLRVGIPVGGVALTAVLLGSIGVPACSLFAQTSKRRQPAAVMKSDRIAEIMQETLKQGEGSAQGVHTYTRVPPSAQAIRELRQLGPEAIGVLAEYTSTGDARHQSLAIELLGRIGGGDVIAPLDRVLRTSASVSLRELALRWLPSEPNGVIRKILTRTAETDSDNAVRMLARKKLTEQSAK